MRRIISTVLCLATVASALVIPSVAETKAVITDASGYVFDESIGYLKGVDIGTTASTFGMNFTETVKITKPDGTEIGENDSVGTDYTVYAEKEMKIVVYGDVNRDANVNAKDVSQMLRKLAEQDVNPNEIAGDVNQDGKMNSKDCSRFLQYLAGESVVFGYQPLVYTEEAQIAPYEDIMMNIVMVSSEVKYNKDTLGIDGTPNFHFYCAKNEIEFCQAYIESYVEQTGLSAKLTDFTDKYGNTVTPELLWVDYIGYENYDSYDPEILPPMAQTFDLKENKSQALYIRCNVPSDAVAGLYRATLSIYNSDKQEVKRSLIYLSVWDFALPEETSCKTAFGLSSYDIYATHSLPNGDDWVTYRKYYDYMLENRINCYRLPYEFDDERIDEYMSNPRVNNFLISGTYGGATEKTAEEITAIYNKLSTNEEWMAKAMFYVDDEPLHSAHIQSMESHKSFIDSVWPNARIMVPNHVDQIYEPYEAPVDYHNGEDMMYWVTKYTTVPCPSVRMFEDYGNLDNAEVWYLQYAIDKYGTLEDRMEGLRAEGRELWWYTTGLKISWSFDQIRSLFWTQYHYDYEGILYFLMNEWNGIKKHSIGLVTGILVYPGTMYKTDGPVPSIRCEVVRDGIEDFEYLKMIEEIYGREKAMEFCDRISTSVDVRPEDGESITKVRYEMGKLIESYYKAMN